MIMEKERKSNIELLRILAILGVIVLHYNNAKIGGGMAFVDKGSLNYYILYFLESIFVCAVDLFVLISGYFLANTNRRDAWKVIELITQVILFSIAIYLLRVLIGNTAFSLKGIFACLIPNNYFVVLYSVVFLVSPFINKLMSSLKDNELRCFMIIILVLFSVYPTLVDIFGQITGRQWNGLSPIGMYGSQWGYTIVQFMLMYCIGAYLSLKGTDGYSLDKSLIIFFTCVILTLVFSQIDENCAYEYCNPIVISMAVSIFVVFIKINLGYVKWINKLSKGTFSVFLLHGLFLSHIGIKNYVTGNIFFMIGHIVISSVGIYLICWFIYLLYALVTTPIFMELKKKISIQINISE